MNNNTPKKEIIGESRVLHVSRGFAIPMIVIFMAILIVFGLAWFGVLAADHLFDVVINPIIQQQDPEAEEIDIMSIMSPPTSEEQAAKVYATFPTLDTEGIGNAFSTAFDTFPEDGKIIKREIVSVGEFAYSGISSALGASPEGALEWLTAKMLPRLSESADVIGSASKQCLSNMGVWIISDLFEAVDTSFTIISDTVETYPAKVELWYNDHLPFRSLIFNANELADNYIEKNYGDIQNSLAQQLKNASNAYNVLIGEAVIGSPNISNPGDDSGDEFDDLFGDETDSSEESEETEETLPPLEGSEETIPEYVETGDEGDEDEEKCEHVLSEESEILQPATCTEWGIAGYRCLECGEIAKREYTAKHTKDAGTVEKASTCSENGIMAYHCVECGALISREYINKLTHNYEMISNNVDTVLCGASYTTVEKCSLCNNEKTKTQYKAHTEGRTLKTVQASYATYGYTLVECSECKGQYRKDLKNKHKYADTDKPLPLYRSDDVMEGIQQWLFYRGNNSQAYFEGTNLMTDAELVEYTSVMTTLNNICKEKGITLQICIWPNKDQVYNEYVTWEPVTSEKRVDRLVKYVQENSEVKIIYPIKELKNAKPYFDTYLKYDTHWNSAGGFVGYQAMLASLGLETMDVKNVPIYEYTGGNQLAKDHYYTQVWGDMIGLGGLSTSNYTKDHNYYIKYRPEVIVESQTGGNGANDTRHTTASNATYDCNFVMLADSYRVMQLGYLEKDFSDCFLTHRSHVNDADVKEAIKNSDILVIAAVERFDSDTLNTAKAIIKILTEE